MYALVRLPAPLLAIIYAPFLRRAAIRKSFRSLNMQVHYDNPKLRPDKRDSSGTGALSLRLRDNHKKYALFVAPTPPHPTPPPPPRYSVRVGSDEIPAAAAAGRSGGRPD